jgi:gamma-glutamylcyclotransferase (GGCT)/AIG2-like uncharacterized protein YtfP
MRDYLFVYGTLRPKQADSEVADIVKRLRKVGAARVRGRLYDFGDYPGAVIDASSNTAVHGELVELPDQTTLEALDQYEEFDSSRPAKSLFVRKKAKITLADGRNVEAWIYVYNRDPGDAPIVRGGNYLRSKVA